MLKISIVKKTKGKAKKNISCTDKGSMRAYSLGIMIVANTVGSQHVVTRFLGFEGNAAGF